MPFIFACIILFVIVTYIIYADTSTWNLYIEFADSWLEMADKEQKYLDELLEKYSAVTDPYELMLYDSIIGLERDAIKRCKGYADEWMNKIPKWYLNLGRI